MRKITFEFSHDDIVDAIRSAAEDMLSSSAEGRIGVSLNDDGTATAVFVPEGAIDDASDCEYEEDDEAEILDDET